MSRVLLQTKQITKELLQKISISKDQESVYLNVDLMGRYKIEKTFKNNFVGLHLLELECEKLGTEDKVFRYLRIGEMNEQPKPQGTGDRN